jgi:hypothetical protein
MLQFESAQSMADTDRVHCRHYRDVFCLTQPPSGWQGAGYLGSQENVIVVTAIVYAVWHN